MFTIVQGCAPSFRAAQLNIVATSDNHGNLLTYPMLAQTIENNKNDIFVKSGEPSTLNVFAVAGDWFMNPSKRGFVTNPKDSSGKLQLKFLNQMIDFVKVQAGKNSNFETVFALGNHDLDAGDTFVYNVIDSKKFKTLITNADEKNSPKLKKLMEKNPNIVKSQVFSIPDDKNPNLNHKVLFIGATIPSMQFYNPGLLKDLKFFDDCDKKDAKLKKEDLQKTINSIREEVKTFKDKNPKGAVVLLSHMGNPISKMVRDEVPDIDVILNGHDHKNLITVKGSTNIDSLGKDNEIIKSLNLKFDDDGNLEKDINTYYTKTTSKVNLEQNPIQKLANELLREDLKPIVSLTDISGNKTDLPFSEDIRYKNSYLANWLTSAVKRPIRDLLGGENVIVGIQSSIIRGGLRDGSNNLDIMKIFDGVSEDLSDIGIGNVTGEELVGLITENIKENLKAPKRSTIIQWSDIQINRTLISDIIQNKSNKSYADAIKIRDEFTKEFKPIKLDKEYKIAIGQKFLVKDDIEWPRKIRNKFKYLNKTYDQLLRSYIASDNINYQLKITPKTKENRIL